MIGSCQIHLKDDARARAAEALYPTTAYPKTAGLNLTDSIAAHEAWKEVNRVALDCRAAFTGPYFKNDVEDVGIEGGFVHVELADGTAYSYPVTDIARIKTYRS